MASPSYNRESLFYSTPDAEPPRRTSTSFSPWNNFSRHSPEDLSFTLPMPVSNMSGTTGPQHFHRHRQRYPWQDPISNSPNSQRQQPRPSTPPAPLDLEEEDDGLFGSTPDFDSFDWDSLPRSPASHQAFHTTRESSLVDLTETSPATMPRTANKRRPSSTDAKPTSKRRKNESTSLHDAKVEDDEGKSKTEVEELDLVDVEDDSSYAEAMKKRQTDLIKQQRQEESDKPVRLATTQCVICLDQPEALVVTHCGHMFCSLCLHGALNIGIGKRTCPVCRTAIGAPRKDGKQPKNGVFHLDMKLMSKKQGKKPALR